LTCTYLVESLRRWAREQQSVRRGVEEPEVGVHSAAHALREQLLEQPAAAAPHPSLSGQRETHHGAAMKKLRIVRLGFGTARKKMVLE
jgi:hypothetical protein